MVRIEMLKSSALRAAVVALAGIGAVGCASTAEYSEARPSGNIYAGADRMYLDNYVRALPDREVAPELVEEIVRGEETPRNEAWLLASYSGVEGARLAHQMFDVAEAEKLDGACEPVVKIANNENLMDIAEYCDVPLKKLMAYNPTLNSARFVADGQFVNIPGGRIESAPGGILRGRTAAQLAQFYSVQPGDSLNKIAYTFGASPVDLQTLNPGVDWTVLPVGQKLVVPAAGVQSGAPAVMGSVMADEGDYSDADADESVYGVSPGFSAGGSIVAPKPYQMKPIPDSLAPSDHLPVDPVPSISVSDRFVAPGANVTLSGRNLPANSDVAIRRGPNGTSLSNVKTVRTDSTGAFSTTVKVPSKTDLGGVIFEAAPADGSDEYRSERVGVKQVEADD